MKPKPSQSAAADREPESRLVRRLGLGDAVLLGLGAMIGTGVFVVFSPAAAAAGAGLLVALGPVWKPKGALEAGIYYGLAEVVYQALLNGGRLPVLTLKGLRDSAGSLLFSPEMGVWQSGAHAPLMEVDVWAIAGRPVDSEQSRARVARFVTTMAAGFVTCR